MEQQRKKEVTALNDAKRQQITKLTEKHLEEFHRIKAYYNETTHQEHFTLIEQLKVGKRSEQGEKRKEDDNNFFDLLLILSPFPTNSSGSSL